MKSRLERKLSIADIVHAQEFFGEVELLKNCQRMNTIRCIEDCNILILNKTDFFESNISIGLNN